MEIPVEIQRFFLRRSLEQLCPTSKSNKEYCPSGCDPKRVSIAISKPGRKKRGTFVPVFYKKQKPSIDQISGAINDKSNEGIYSQRNRVGS